MSKIILLTLAIVLVFAGSTQAAITNGHFTDNLDGWTVSPYEWVTIPGEEEDETEELFLEGVIHFGETAKFLQLEIEDYTNSTLTSETSFTFDAVTQYLTFEVEMTGLPSETDRFTASLYNDTDGVYEATVLGNNYFYYLDSYLIDPTNDLITNTELGSGVSVVEDVDYNGATRIVNHQVRLDVSGLVGSGDEFKLIFNLNHEYEGNQTEVVLDNVLEATAIIPAPAAVLLAGIGVGCFGYLRRRKML